MHRNDGRLPELPVTMSDLVAKRVIGVGRTEDVVVSPDGRRIAVAAFNDHEIVIIEHTVTRDPLHVSLSSLIRVGCNLMARPHGLAWVDDDTIVVGNRAAEVLLLDISDAMERADSDGRAAVHGRVLLDRDGRVAIDSPGSVVVRPGDGPIREIIVCNNYIHNVSRHVVDVDDPFGRLDDEVLLAAGLNVPDGVTVSPAGDWIAISNHCTHEVFVYRNDPELGPMSEPLGVLGQVNYPHGVRFTVDGRFLLVADAGLPFVHVYHAPDGDWQGRREPFRTVRVMDDDTFNAARYNPQEGGPKGLEILHDPGVVVVTSQAQPLTFFDLADFTGNGVHEPAAGRADPHSDPRVQIARRLARRMHSAEASLARMQEHSNWQATVIDERDQHIAALGDQLEGLVEQRAQLSAEIERLTSELALTTEGLLQHQQRVADLEAMIASYRASTSWRLTRPMRAVVDRVRQR